MKTYIIKKGTHSSFRLPKFIWNPKGYKIKFSFTNSCKYVTSDINNQNDINKLFGFSRGIHMLPQNNNLLKKMFGRICNSIRIGWRYNIKNDNFEIFKYKYINGTRCISDVLVALKANQEYTISIGDMFYTNFPLGYLLFPYFGGDEKAPKNMYINLKYEKN